jgi:predicted nucleic acid-binding protein
MRVAEAAIIDSVIIFDLARARCLDKLFKVFRVVYVPRAVRREVRFRGRQRRRRDVVRFRERATPCDQHDRTVFDQALATFRRLEPRLSHRGEAEMIAQAKYRGVGLILTQDEDATRFARSMGLDVWGTPRLLRLLLSEEEEL